MLKIIMILAKNKNLKLNTNYIKILGNCIEEKQIMFTIIKWD